jgi:membrane-associated phospholipid phosphatase
MMRRTVVVTVVIGAASALSSILSPAAAQSSDNSASPVHLQEGRDQPNTELRYDLPLDLTITASGAAIALSLELLAPKLAPSTCHWCDRDANGTDTLNGFDASIRSHVRWSDTAAADKASTVIGYGLAPLAAAGVGTLLAAHDHRLSEVPVDALVVAEATVIALNINQVSKFLFARQRPEVHFRSPEQRAANKSTEDNLSFYSGHTTFAFALGTSAGTVASMRRYQLAPIIWISGILLAAATGYLRIAADQHYATDVISGAVMGSAVGFGIPYFVHHPTAASIRLTAMPSPGGGGLAVSGQW